MLATLLNPNLCLAMLCYIIASTGILLLTARYAEYIDKIEANHNISKAFSEWYIQHIWWPLGKTLALLLFILLAYPALFKIPKLPLTTLAQYNGNLNNLLNSLFLIGILLPFLPLARPFYALILPLQACIAIALIFSLISRYYGLPNVHYLPHLHSLPLLIGFGFAGHWLTQKTSRYVGEWLDSHSDYTGFPNLIYHSSLLLFQAPVLILYAGELTTQLPAH